MVFVKKGILEYFNLNLVFEFQFTVSNCPSDLVFEYITNDKSSHKNHSTNSTIQKMAATFKANS